jgi:Cytidylyltransferase-like
MKVVFACGRMNPPTEGHRKMVEEMKALALREGRQVRLFATRTHDRFTNPLAPDEKLDFLRRVFPDVNVTLATNPFEAAQILAQEGFTDAVFVVGEDRINLAESFVQHRDDLGLTEARYHFVKRPFGAPSASQARSAAKTGKFVEFRRLVPSKDEHLVQELYRAVRLGLGEGWPQIRQ